MLRRLGPVATGQARRASRTSITSSASPPRYADVMKDYKEEVEKFSRDPLGYLLDVFIVWTITGAAIFYAVSGIIDNWF
jgi:hypothetical protein